MEKTFMKGLGAVVAVSMVCLMSSHISSCSSSGGSGTGKGGSTKNIIIVDTLVRAGSQLAIECPKCAGPAQGRVVIGKVPYDIPAKSIITITFVNGADSTRR
jgi:hypothetical protein